MISSYPRTIAYFSVTIFTGQSIQCDPNYNSIRIHFEVANECLTFQYKGSSFQSTNEFFFSHVK